MTKQQKSYNSTQSVKHSSLKKLLRSALVAGVVGGFVSPALAQNDLTLPAFPENSAELTLPVQHDVSLPLGTVEPRAFSPSTSQRVAVLLGIKKLAPTVALPQNSEVVEMPPSFPSTEPTAFVQPSAYAGAKSNSHAPTIFRSTSGRTDNSQTEPYTTSITLASADESLSQIEIPTRLTVQPVAALDELTEAEYLDASSNALTPVNELANEQSESSVETLVDSSTETLVDIEVPKILVELPQPAAEALPTQEEPVAVPTLTQTTPLLPQLIPAQTEQLVVDNTKRSPAIQLHIGGGVGVQSSISDSEQSAPPQSNFSMSDAGESEAETTLEAAPIKASTKTLKVRIEGEPAQVVSRSIASVEPHSVSQTKQSFDPAGYGNLPNSASDGTKHVGIQSLGIQSLGGPLANGQSARSQSLTTQSSPSPATQNFSNPGSSSNNDDLIVSQAMVSQSIGQKPVTESGPAPAPTLGERIEVGMHESSNIETAQPLSGLSVEHAEICQVLKNGERSLSIVGLKAGQTRIALFMTSPSGERKIEVREVIVAGTENRQADMNSLATEITKSVRRMYPNSRIEVISEDDGLAVQGYAGSEAEAKKIIGLIRRTSLQPVFDRLATYK